MSCEKEYIEMLAAIEAWVAASGRASTFISTTPISKSEDILPMDGKAMVEAYDKENEAKEIFFKASQAFLDANRKHHTTP